jgi:hypothetical protein
MSVWLAYARADGGGLLIPGGPGPHGADLVLTPTDVRVRFEADEASLSWQDFGPSTSRGQWTICGWGSGNDPFIGVGLAGPESLAPIRQASFTKRNRFLRWNPYNRLLQNDPVPLWAPANGRMRIVNESATMKSLCMVLAERPALRLLLADAHRMTTLASDLAQHSVSATHPGAVFAKATSVIGALHALGYEHHYFGRPLPGEPLDDRDMIVAKVLQRMAANPYGAVAMSPEQVGELVDQRYLKVQPWPFAALDV